MMDKETVLRQSPNVTFQTVAGEAILIRMDTGTYFSLNEVGTDFWEQLDGKLTLAQHAAQIAQKYNAKSAAFAAAVFAMAQQGQGDAAALAAEYGLDEKSVNAHLAEIDPAAKAESQTAAIRAAYAVSTEMVLDDLLPLAQMMQAEKLVEVG